MTTIDFQIHSTPTQRRSRRRFTPRDRQRLIRLYKKCGQNAAEFDLYGLFLDKWTGGGAQVIHIARVAEAPPPTQ